MVGNPVEVLLGVGIAEVGLMQPLADGGSELGGGCEVRGPGVKDAAGFGGSLQSAADGHGVAVGVQDAGAVGCGDGAAGRGALGLSRELKHFLHNV